jgi:hypothetical protein
MGRGIRYARIHPYQQRRGLRHFHCCQYTDSYRNSVAR